MSKRNRWKLAAVVLVCVGIVCVVLTIKRIGRFSPTERIDSVQNGEPSSTAPIMESPTASTQPKTTENPASDEPEYVSPIDFESLWEINPDICGWIEFENTDMSFPVVQNKEDDTFYLTHNSEREESRRGALFIENYNYDDFSDPVTIIYGHYSFFPTMSSYDLQVTYTEEDCLSKYGDITLYLPGEERIYHVFAAVPYETYHLMYHYNMFEDERDYKKFVDSLFSVRSLSATTDESLRPSGDQRVLVISTCFDGYSNQRFLVVAAEEKMKIVI